MANIQLRQVITSSWRSSIQRNHHSQTRILLSGVNCGKHPAFPDVRMESVKVWFASPLSIRTDQLSNVDIADWLSSLMEHSDKMMMVLVFALIWAIWKRRNDWNFKNRRRHFNDVLQLWIRTVATWLVSEGEDVRSYSFTWRPTEAEFSLEIGDFLIQPQRAGFWMIGKSAKSFSPFIETRVDESADGTQWRRVDSTNDFVNIDFQNLTVDEVLKYSFRDLDLGYDFYNAYGGAKGFSIRRHLTGRNTKGEIVSKSFVCSKQAKQFVGVKFRGGVDGGSSCVVSRYTSLVMLCRRMCAVACISLEKYNALRDKVFDELAELEKEEDSGTGTTESPPNTGDVTDPPMSGPESAGKHCSRCRAVGHNVRRCPVNIEEISDDVVDYSAYDDEQPDNSDSELETV
ncbi:hypothetical protein RIF29_25173 [Crotalaria pallida]|uniref:Uncharacterized protein n=1 Tax=Crotalaria pallida TaxID=3830 RepID=A0AAN9ELY2_CROPI